MSQYSSCFSVTDNFLHEETTKFFMSEKSVEQYIFETIKKYKSQYDITDVEIKLFMQQHINNISEFIANSGNTYDGYIVSHLELFEDNGTVVEIKTKLIHIQD